MSSRKGGLGKGLDALIPGGMAEPQVDTTRFIEIKKIIPNPRQPRQDFKPEALMELAESIRQHGVLQPLIVTGEAESDRYILIAGERRLRAAELAGLDAVPAVVRQATEQERLELALIENIQRADLTPLETAEAYRALSEEFNLSHEAIAEQVGKNRVTITNTMRLLKLPEAVQRALAEEKISEGHARALLGLNSPQAQTAALNSITLNNLTVRQTEELVRKMNGEKKTVAAPKPVPAELAEIEERLRLHLGTRVTLHHGKKGGSMVIHYYSDEELNALLGRILKE